MVETGTQNVTVYHTGSWHEIVSSCDEELNPAFTTTYAVAWRQWMSIDASTVPVGTQYEVEISAIKNGVVTAQQVLSRRIRTVVSDKQPQGDYMGGFLSGLNGAQGYRIRIRLIGSSSGYVHFPFVFASLQGARAEYGSASTTNAASFTLDPTWRIIGSVVVNNTSGGDADLQLQGTFTIESGTSGQRGLLGFGKGTASSGNHSSFIYVPPVLPESVTAFDFMPNEGVSDTLIPPGQTTINVWARVDSGTVTISNRRLDALSMGVGATAANADTARTYTMFHGPTLHSETTTGVQPQDCLLLDKDAQTNGGKACNQKPDDVALTGAYAQTYAPGCGKWTQLLETPISLPANAKWRSSTGGGYLQILGKSCASGGDACWSGATWAQVAIETVTNSPSGSQSSADFHFTTFSVPNTPTSIYFFEDAFNWGNADGNIMRLWVRLVGYPCTNGAYQTDRQLTIGRRYLGVRFFEPTGDLYIAR